ncbi:MAG: protein-glutamate O-methyltransferase CheR [Syntrophothermus sp.]|uniref:CheR family methyltransferase n=1 Tax=Syntrophothermus sp. TaxID=2736299 RepID=UPI00257DA0F3|nr:protein-glutamate O-methyltransferase CheR [Syntrophothermus sp.]NSW82013.1 protein-glutamate O-methyltransferase CheR [Syntrophothermus sp.]
MSLLEENLGWDWFIKKFHEKSGIDLAAYKRPQMERRIGSFMRSVDARNYASFIKVLENDPVVYRKFLDHLTINVSEFFRNSNHWDILRKDIMPALIRQRAQVRAWSAGCSTGEEPYSLALLFQEHFPQRFEKILATDIDQDALEKAKTGLYLPKSLQAVPQAWVKKYFEEVNGYFRIKDELKNCVRFERHDLLKDRYPSNMDLILCRNVVIYFTEEAKEKLYRRFVDALRPGGVLFIGSTEQIFKAREIGLKSVATFFYEKAAD